MGWWKKSEKKSKKGRRKYEERVPPEGGWGWMVVAGYTLTSVVSIPIIQNFGLIFKQRLADLNLTSTDVTTIISLNSAIGQIFGVAQGPLLKTFGYRKMAVFGVATFTIGTFLTGLSQSLLQFILTYGVITSIGFTYTLTSFSLAMSSYFRIKRSRASGLLMGFGGLGPVFMPQLVTFSLGMYGATQTSFLLAALNANGFIGASLLRPIHWYAKKKKTDKEDCEKCEITEATLESEMNCIKKINNLNISTQGPITGPYALRRQSNANALFPYERQASIEMKLFANGDGICGEHIGGIGNRRESRVRSISACEDNQNEKDNLNFKRRSSTHGSLIQTVKEEEAPSIYYSCHSVLKSYTDLRSIRPQKNMLASQETLDSMGSSFGIALVPYFPRNDCQNDDDDEYIPIAADDSEEETIIEDELDYTLKDKFDGTKENEDGDEKISIALYLKNLFDLDLLTEPKYIIVTLGLSIAVIGEVMFSLLTPFILAEVGLDIQQTAYFMSIIGVADIISRFISPYLGELVHFNSRVMYIIALFCLLFSRASLLMVSGSVGYFIVAVAVGFAKGVRTVFWIQVLPDNVDAKKLPSAMSIQNLMNGLMILVAGPLAGKIMEINNSYLNMIYISNALTGLTILLWAGEYVVIKLLEYKRRNCNLIPDVCS